MLSDHNLCVAPIIGPWQFAGMDQADKNGGPNNLRAWREKRGLSQEQLAALVEPPTSANMIQYLESGERGLSLKWLRRLAEALRTTTGHLAEFTPDQVEESDIDWWLRRKKEERERLKAIAEAMESTGTNSK